MAAEAFSPTPGNTHRLVIVKHHALVRISHWLNIPLLLGLTLSGLSIYWASPVYKHAPEGDAGNEDYIANVGVWIVHHVPGLHGYGTPPTWVYDHFSLGTGLLAAALRLHWFFAYLFMLNGLVYIVGLLAGGGYRALLPRVSDVRGAISMGVYYAGLLPHKLLRLRWKHPVVTTKYNSLQKLAYFFVPLCGGLSVLTGWAIHKPQQLGWLQSLFGGYDTARLIHFWLMWVFMAFVIPHVILIFADGWDTFRSMIVGWSERAGVPHDAQA